MFEAAGCFPCGVGKIHQCLTLFVKNASNLERFQKHALRFFENNFPRFSLLDAGNHRRRDFAGLSTTDRAIRRIRQG